MRFPRSSGILLPVFSLPGPFGIGDMGPTARRFVDFLNSSGQTIWQVLPFGPTSQGNSPYSSYSAFAGNALLISPESLGDDGLLDEHDISAARCDDRSPHFVDYDQVTVTKTKILQQAFAAFRETENDQLKADYTRFCEEQADWLNDFTLFDALRQHYCNADWSTWDAEIVHREAHALQNASEKLRDRIDHSRFLQFIFYRQWQQLKTYANQNNVRIYGDMPIFLAYESADVWVNQELFCLDNSGRPTVVAGVPPDYFSETGQMWGNPLYRWDRLAETEFHWWTQRFRRALNDFDILRIDHFRGFESYWEIPADAENAMTGEWKKGPGTAPFDAAKEALGPLPIVAEDLGLITDDVHDLRDELGFPGMRVLQFGFAHADDPFHRPEAYPQNSVAYTGTHDNDTTMSWFGQQATAGNPILSSFVPCDAHDIHIRLNESVLNSAADTAILPMQDVLALGNDARMNTPGQADGNWRWRCSQEALNEQVSGQLKELTVRSNRMLHDSGES